MPASESRAAEGKKLPRVAELETELRTLDTERTRLLEDRQRAEHPVLVEDTVDQAEDLVEQETIDALLEAGARRREQVLDELSRLR